MLWKVNAQDLEPVSGSTFADLKIKEQSLEDWVEHKPEILGEPLLIIGRQVSIAGIENRIDLLALDREGKLVVIEAKRDRVDIPSDFQALRYAAVLANWKHDDIKKQTESYYRDKHPDSEPHFQELIDDFFEEEEEVDLNEDQRIIIVGRNVHERLVGVADWLLNHSVNIKVVEISLFLDNGTVLVSPRVVLAQESLPVGEGTGGLMAEHREDGKNWHLQKRCSTKTAPLMELLAERIPAVVTVENVSWNQKHYVAFRLHGRNWLTVDTHPNYLFASFHVAPSSFQANEIAKLLGVEVFDHGKPLAEKLDARSSVLIEHRENRDAVRIRIKPGFQFDSEGFSGFVRQAHLAALR